MENKEILNNNNIDESKYNKDEMVTPDWINLTFLENILKNVEHVNDIEIIEHKISPGSMKGDHFASVMFRVEMKYKFPRNNIIVTKSKSIIIKSMPEQEGIKKEMLQESFLFDTEIKIYSEIMPKYKEALKDVNDYKFLTAEMVYSSLKPKKIVVFEDLKELGFRTFEEKRFLTLEESKIPFKALAVWHALSYKFLNEKEELIKQFQNGTFDMPNSKTNDIFIGGIDKLLTFLNSKPGNEIYIEKLNKIKKPLYETLFSKETCYDDNWNVLSHGDFHLKNMMFHFNKENKIEDVVLLDFQISKYITAANDILYGLYMICDHDTRTNHRDELIHFYYTEFIDTLKKISYNGKIPTLLQLHQAILNYRHFELFLIATFLPVVGAFIRSEYDIDVLVESAEAKLKCYYNPDVQKEFAELLPKLLHKGYLDDY